MEIFSGLSIFALKLRSSASTKKFTIVFCVLIALISLLVAALMSVASHAWGVYAGLQRRYAFEWEISTALNMAMIQSAILILYLALLGLTIWLAGRIMRDAASR